MRTGSGGFTLGAVIRSSTFSCAMISAPSAASAIWPATLPPVICPPVAAELLVAAGVIRIGGGVDDVADRLRRQRPDRREHLVAHLDAAAVHERDRLRGNISAATLPPAPVSMKQMLAHLGHTEIACARLARGNGQQDHEEPTKATK